MFVFSVALLCGCVGCGSHASSLHYGPSVLAGHRLL